MRLHIVVMGKIAVPIWQNRVSPVLDSATSLLIVQFNRSEMVGKEIVYLPITSLAERARIIVGRGVDAVLCGAISRSLNDLLARAGIKVYAWLTGDLDEVLGAYRRGDLNNERFLLPGCGRGRRKRSRRWRDGHRRRRAET